jgi:hypothetical protein
MTFTKGCYWPVAVMSDFAWDGASAEHQMVAVLFR